MELRDRQIFTWPIDWTKPVNGRWDFDMREFTIGFGPELQDIHQSDVIHGFSFSVQVRDDEVDNLDAFFDAIKGRSYPFWMPGPNSAYRVVDGISASQFKISDQGAGTNWLLHPGSYIYATKAGEQAQSYRITAITSNGDGTETVTVEQALDIRESSSSSSLSSNSSSYSTLSESSSSSSSSSSNSSSSSESSSHSYTSSSSYSYSSSSSNNSSSSSSEVSSWSLSSLSSSSSSNNSYSSSSNESRSSSSSSVTSSSSSLESESSSSSQSYSSATSVSSLSSSSSSLEYSTESSSESSASESSSSSSTSLSSGDNVSSSSSSSEPLPIDETWCVQPLYLVRLADDVERVQVMAERWQTRSFRVVELPNDYSAAIEDPARPIFLYRFTAPLPDGDVVWRFTSHPTDVIFGDPSSSSSSSSETSSSSSESSSSSSSSGDFTSVSSASSSSSSTSSSSSSSSSGGSSSSPTSVSSGSSSSKSSSSSSGPEAQSSWLAVGIDHGVISRSVKLGGSVTVKGDYDTIEPLRLCIPVRIFSPLRLEILETTTDLDTLTVIFNGTVGRPELVGRQVRVSVSEWGSVMDNKIPSFFIQRRCNYRVFDSKCRADQSSFEQAVTVTSISGRVATVSGMTGAGSDFAEGWIEVGSGIDKQIRFIMDSTSAGVLTLSDPLVAEVPVSATIVPGCDGFRNTCITKFDNLDNFGGQETPRDNLTLNAIKTETQAGKK